MSEMVEWTAPHVMRATDPIFTALDAARIALYRAQRGDGNIDFDATDRLLSAAMDLRHGELANEKGRSG